MATDDLGEVRLSVEPRTGDPVFVGIAPTDRVSTYLGGVAHSSVSDVDSWPFETNYAERTVAGDRKPRRPASSRSGRLPPRAQAPRRSTGTSRTATGPWSS